MIYVTQYDDELMVRGISVDSHFKSINDVIAALGDEHHHKTKRSVYYDNVVFSDFPFNLDDNNEST